MVSRHHDYDYKTISTDNIRRLHKYNYKKVSPSEPSRESEAESVDTISLTSIYLFHAGAIERSDSYEYQTIAAERNWGNREYEHVPANTIGRSHEDKYVIVSTEEVSRLQTIDRHRTREYASIPPDMLSHHHNYDYKTMSADNTCRLHKYGFDMISLSEPSRESETASADKTSLTSIHLFHAGPSEWGGKHEYQTITAERNWDNLKYEQVPANKIERSHEDKYDIVSTVEVSRLQAIDTHQPCEYEAISVDKVCALSIGPFEAGRIYRHDRLQRNTIFPFFFSQTPN